MGGVDRERSIPVGDLLVEPVREVVLSAVHVDVAGYGSRVGSRVYRHGHRDWSVLTGVGEVAVAVDVVTAVGLENPAGDRGAAAHGAGG